MNKWRGIATRILNIRYSSLFRNSFYLIFGSGLGALLGFVFWALAARLYPPEYVGTASAAVSALAFTASIAHLGMGHGFIRFLPGMTPQNAGKTIGAALLLAGGLSVIVAAIYLCGLDVWSSKMVVLRSQPWLIAGFIATALISVLTILIDNVFISRRQAAFVTLRGLIFNLSKIAVLLILFQRWAENGVLGAWASGVLVSLVAAVVLLKKSLPEYVPTLAVKASQIGQIIKYSIVNNVAGFLWGASATLLPLLVIQRLGPAENAYFYIAWAMASTLALIPASVSTSLFAEGSHESERLMDNTWRALGIVLAVILPVIAAALILARPVLSIFGAGYTGATPLFHWLVITLIPLSLNQIYFGVLRVRNRLKELIFLCASIMVITITGSYILLPGHGLVAAGWSWFAAQSATALWIIAGRGRLMLLFRRGVDYLKRP